MASYYRGDIDADMASIVDSPWVDEAVMLDQIAKKIGYGRAQQILQVLWARNLRDQRIPTMGALLPDPPEAVKESLTTAPAAVPDGVWEIIDAMDSVGAGGASHWFVTRWADRLRKLLASAQKEAK